MWHAIARLRRSAQLELHERQAEVPFGFVEGLDFQVVANADQDAHHSQSGHGLLGQRKPLPSEFDAVGAEARDVATGVGERADEAVPEGSYPATNTIGTFEVEAAAATAMVSKGAMKTSGYGARSSAVRGARRAPSPCVNLMFRTRLLSSTHPRSASLDRNRFRLRFGPAECRGARPGVRRSAASRWG